MASGGNSENQLQTPGLSEAPTNQAQDQSVVESLGLPGPSTSFSLPGPSTSLGLPGPSTSRGLPGPSTRRSPPSLSPLRISSPKDDDSHDKEKNCPNLTSELIEELLLLQLQHMYAQGKLPFNPQDALFSPHAPMFTITQMKRAIKGVAENRENQVQQMFDRILNEKTKEDHEAFVKFSDDQLQRKDDKDAAKKSSYMK